MRFEKRILVAIKGSVGPEAVVERTRLIAGRLGAEVLLMAASRSLGAAAEEHLAMARAALEQAGITVSVVPRQRRDLLTDLVLTARERECGLLIKAPDRPRGLDVVLPPRDWKLLRCSPCPVLMVRRSSSWVGAPLLVAIDAAPGDAAHAGLNQKLLRLGGEIGRLGEMPLELVSAYPAPMQSSDRLHQSAEEMARVYRAQAEALCRAEAVQAVAIHIDEGPAETLIPQLARERQPGLVVLGTVARRGLKAALLGGNTAEAILSRLAGDVLTLQPQGSDEVLELLADTDVSE
ncbi:universal stress protein [Motiliproteus sediminis]|uniref:universal stress protein n=1 Tax=Motiliproteus sediminis TaxID=1468178 RepID=UPI001AEF886C|nr:universal stress protein [Motiliproteus sediminis]